jgi:hypothetical protein
LSALERLALVLVLSAAVLVLVLEWGKMAEPIFDHEKLDVYRLSIEYVAASSDGVAQAAIEYEYEYRDVEHE